MVAGHGHGAERPTRVLTLALILTTSFMVVEAGVALWSGSLALLADAGHMLGDSGALLLALFVAHVARRPRNPRKTFGYARAEVLGALANAALLFAMATWIVIEAVGRISDPPAVRATGMLVAAVLGLLVNVVAAWVLTRGDTHNVNLRAALWHVLGDALGSVAAIAAAVLIVTLGWRQADPVASLLISVLLCVGAFRLMLETTHVLMQGVPSGLDVKALEETIAGTDGVASVHDMHVWCVTQEEPVLSAHVVIEPGTHGTDVVQRVANRLRREHGLQHSTIQPEAPPPDDNIVPLRRLRRGSSDTG